ncbi:hypothetical protein ROA7450_03819 [Roseovarius albus]|uniref:Uncharacterized protein n=1 Tax=Roseovarius albus TaxID=1247867 RepID=A0A1X7A4K6_9RHOB|nr:hypothetical protein ROA7450_03819 [Roseovarius albus]
MHRFDPFYPTRKTIFFIRLETRHIASPSHLHQPDCFELPSEAGRVLLPNLPAVHAQPLHKRQGVL